jgi:hypothetical protein
MLENADAEPEIDAVTVNATTTEGEEPLLPLADMPTETAETVTPIPPSVVEIRNEWQQRIAAETRLPQPLRLGLSKYVETAEIAPQSQEPYLSVSQVAQLFGETFPFLVARPVQVVEHPQGETFFQRDQDLTPETAARLAREQLARTGF